MRIRYLYCLFPLFKLTPDKNTYKNKTYCTHCKLQEENGYFCIKKNKPTSPCSNHNLKVKILKTGTQTSTKEAGSGAPEG